MPATLNGLYVNHLWSTANDLKPTLGEKRKVIPLAKLIFQDWIVDLGRDPQTSANCFEGKNWDIPRGADENPEAVVVNAVAHAVRQAIEALPATEQELVARVHFMGESLADVSRKSGRSLSRVRGMHQRALRKLKKHLSEFTRQQYGIKSKANPSCPICASPFRSEIDALIECRDRSRSWSPVISDLRRKWSLRIISPQLLIGHEKYHR